MKDVTAKFESETVLRTEKDPVSLMNKETSPIGKIALHIRWSAGNVVTFQNDSHNFGILASEDAAGMTEQKTECI